MNDMWGNPMSGSPSNGFNFTNFPKKYEIIKVNGEAGARNFKMAPNSTALLWDENEPIVWFVQTDGAGYCAVTPYDISIHQTLPPVDVNKLEQRVAQLEDIINARQSNSQPNKSKKQSFKQQPILEQSLDTVG